MKHAEFLIWRRREDKAKAKLFVSKSSGLWPKQQALPPLRVIFQNGSGPKVGGKFESLCFGYYMIAVSSGKGIIPRGTQT